MIGKLGFAAAALLTCTAASATATDDKRIRKLEYNPDRIVQIVGRSGIQSTIEFGSDERIENIAVGDSAAWQITPNRRASLLFLKPMVAKTRTNMTVVTDRRTYMFDLVAGGKEAAPVYALMFSYPDDQPAKAAALPVQAPPPPPRPPTAAEVAAKLHFDWNRKGSDKLLPDRVFDDGSSVYLAWRSDTPLPAILTQSEDRKEGPLNYRIDGQYIVVSPVPANLVLRYGKKSAVLWPSHPIVSSQPQIAVAVAPRIASAAPAPPVQHQAPPAPAPAAMSGAVTLADLATLFNDKPTDTRHER